MQRDRRATRQQFVELDLGGIAGSDFLGVDVGIVGDYLGVESVRQDARHRLADGADADTVRRAIVTMPHYFDEYDTTVTFISADELRRDHGAMPHGGFVIRSGSTGSDASGSESRQVMEYSLKLDSNPQFTASVLVAYARATVRLAQQGASGAKTVFDVAPGLLSPHSAEQLRAEQL